MPFILAKWGLHLDSMARSVIHAVLHAAQRATMQRGGGRGHLVLHLLFSFQESVLDQGDDLVVHSVLEVSMIGSHHHLDRMTLLLAESELPSVARSVQMPSSQVGLKKGEETVVDIAFVLLLKMSTLD